MNITVHADGPGKTTGTLTWMGRTVPCALGFGGVRKGTAKREGDGTTPAGAWPLRRLFYRADRVDKPQTGLACHVITPDDGWCDDPADRAYNQLIRLPNDARHEVLWRTDGLYDLVVELGYNDSPPEPGRGSAIFLHIAREGYAPTEGCVAVARADLIDLLADCDGGATMDIIAPE